MEHILFRTSFFFWENCCTNDCFYAKVLKNQNTQLRLQLLNHTVPLFGEHIVPMFGGHTVPLFGVHTVPLCLKQNRTQVDAVLFPSRFLHDDFFAFRGFLGLWRVVHAQDGARTRIRTLLEKRTRDRHVHSGLGRSTLVQTGWPGSSARKQTHMVIQCSTRIFITKGTTYGVLPV